MSKLKWSLGFLIAISSLLICAFYFLMLFPDVTAARLPEDAKGFAMQVLLTISMFCLSALIGGIILIKKTGKSGKLK